MVKQKLVDNSVALNRVACNFEVLKLETDFGEKQENKT
jgi:hypothetical protein